MTPTEQDDELREQLDELLKSPRYGVSLFAGHRDILVEILSDFITADRKRVALEAAVMGAKFGNAAIRQHNIADPAKPMNLDVVRDSGIQQAKAWAERQC